MERHNPCSKLSPLARSLKFMIHWRSIVNIHSDTSVCDDCGKMINAPDCRNYYVWAPALQGLITGGIILVLGKLNGWYYPLIVAAIIMLVHWVIPSQIYAFGKWEESRLNGMSDTEYRMYRIQEIEKANKQPFHVAKLVCSCVLGFIFVFAGIYYV